MMPKRKCSPTLRGMVVSNQLDKTEKKRLCKLKTSLSRNISGIVKCILRFCCKFRMKIIFYQTVNTVKPKVVAFLVFFCTSASFIAQISSSENVSTALGSGRKTVNSRVTGANQNERKLLFIDLVNTKKN